MNVDGQRIELDANTGVIIKDAVDKVSNGEVSEGVITALVSRKAEGGWEEAFNYVKKGASNDEIYQNVVRQHADVSGTDAMWDLYNNFGIESTPDDALGILIQKRYDARLKLRDDVAELVNYAQNNTNAAPLRAVRYENGSTVTEGFMIDGKSLGTWLEEGKRAGDYTNLVSRMNQGDQSYTFDWMAGTSMDQNFQNNSLGATKLKWNIEAGVGDAHGVYTDVVYSPLHASEVEWLMAKGTTLDINRAWVDDNGVVNFDARVRGNSEPSMVSNPQPPAKSAKKQIVIESPRSKMSKEKPVSARKPVEPVSAELPKSNPQPVPVEKMNIKEVYGEMDKLHAQMSSMRSGVEVDFDNQIQAAQSQLEGLESGRAAYIESSRAEINNCSDEIGSLSRKKRDIENDLKLLKSRHGKVEQNVIEYRSALYDLEKQLEVYKSLYGVRGNTVGELHNHATATRKRFIGAEMNGNLTETVVPDNAPSYYYNEDIGDLYHQYNITTSAQNKENVVKELRAKLASLEDRLENVNRKIANQEQALSSTQAQQQRVYDRRNSLSAERDAFVEDFNAQKQNIKQSIENLKQAKNNALSAMMETPAYQKLNAFRKQLQARARELS